MITTTSLALRRAVIAVPDPHDADVAPQLVVVAITQVALHGLSRTLALAHPVFDETLPTNPPELDEAEGIARRILEQAEGLSELLARYTGAVHDEIAQHLDDIF